MTNALTISTAAARSAPADAVIVGVTQATNGPVPAPGAEDVDAALGGTLAQTLAALGATGRQDELNSIASGGRITAPLIIAVGLGPADNNDGEQGRLESLRRAAGAAVRAAAGAKSGSVAISLPARDEAETEAVALGALLGRYRFGKYRTGDQPTEPDVTVLSSVGAAAGRAEPLAEAMRLVRDLVNTSPSELYPETFAAEAERVARAAGLEFEALDHVALAGG
ncbi:MAG: leucyl aminopeptidase, partial [Actinobacteria bacterium]|nr:leucyl aminopeptidase [Actinomycetota bacterium]